MPFDVKDPVLPKILVQNGVRPVSGLESKVDHLSEERLSKVEKTTIESGSRENPLNGANQAHLKIDANGCWGPRSSNHSKKMDLF